MSLPHPAAGPGDHVVGRHIFRRLYDWTLSWADSRHGLLALFLLAFAESSFFPVPPDVLLVPLGLGRRERALLFALVCSCGSVVGGMFGYWIGHAAWSPPSLRFPTRSSRSPRVSAAFPS
jgi:membrane protein YqaA with SNARE-associated domain